MFTIHYAESAERELAELPKFDAARIMDEVDEQLRVYPTTPSARRKPLEEVSPPWEPARPPVWQLRVGDFRVFYEVEEELHEVAVRAVRRKGRKTTAEIL